MQLHYVVGDATDPQAPGTICTIVHLVNDAGKWGAGFTKALSRRWPHVEAAYRRWAAGIDGRREAERTLFPMPPLELGRVQLMWADPEADIEVANLVGQHGVRSRANPTPIVLEAVATGLGRVRAHALALADIPTMRPHTIHMPRIGTGLAGGKWDDIEPLIQQELVAHGVPVYVYDLAR